MSRMSTKVDPLTIYSSCLVDTVSGMSTGVDELQTNGSLRVEAVRKMSTGVDCQYMNHLNNYVGAASGMSTKVDLHM